MKKIKFSMLALSVALVGFASCEKPLETPKEPAKAMEIDAEQTYEVISTSPKDVTFNINSNTPWTIESDATWCTATPASSDESSLVEEITVKFENNEEFTTRTAKLTISGIGVEKATVITFNQAPKSNLEIQPITKAFAPAGGEATFTILSNVAWNVKSNMDWLTFDKTEGEGSEQAIEVKAICTANTSAVRKAVVTVTSGSNQKTFEVSQEGLSVKFKEVSPEAKIFKNSGETKIFELETNATELEAITDDKGATAVVKDGKVEVTLDFNGIFTDRKVKVTVYPKGTKPEDFEGNVLEVSQPINWDKYVKDPGKVTFDATTGTATFESVSNGQARINSKTWNTAGRYEFEFEKIEVGNDFLIDVIADNREPAVSWELALGKNQGNGLENSIILNAGGKSKNGDKKKGYVKGKTYPKVEGWSGVKIPFTFTADDAKAMKKLIIEFKKNGADKLDLLVQVDDKVLVQKTVTNPYTHEGDLYGQHYSYNFGAKAYFGFPGIYWNGTPMHGDGTIVMKSAKFTPSL